MIRPSEYSIDLPCETSVIERNRAISSSYAQLYQYDPKIFKWAGMAAFASFHIGEKLKLWDWEKSGIRSLSATCNAKSRTIGDDFQIIRLINNKIFAEIGWMHLAFIRLDFHAFRTLLVSEGKHQIIISAFEKLHSAQNDYRISADSQAANDLVWEANAMILWHEQSEVVQPFFDKVSDLFSRAMTIFATFDYKINHHETRRVARSRFILFMLLKGYHIIKENWYIPQVTNLHHRWFWVRYDILVKWIIVEKNNRLITDEIEILAQLGTTKIRFQNQEKGII